MNRHLTVAYSRGADAAKKDFEKNAQGYYGDYSELMQSPYMQAIQQGSQDGPGMLDKLRTASRATGGGLAGGLGGAALGGGLGYGGGQLAQLLGADVDEEDIRKAMIYGSLLGGGLGAGAGSMGAGGLLGQGQGQGQ